MVLTLLKIVAGLAVLGIVAMVLIAVISGLVASVRALRREKATRDRS
jgi:type II secretory pathway pseudopilin PulG